MTVPSIGLVLVASSLYAAIAVLAAVSVAADTGERVAIPEIESSRLLLRYDRLTYRNFTFGNFANPVDHSYPYRDRPKTFYNSLGDYLLTGYPLFEWTERRSPGQTFGSAIHMDDRTFENVIDNVVIARDGYGGWGYSAMVGEAMIARLSPLTLSRTDFNGARIDIATPYLKYTFLGSRIGQLTSFVDGSVLLLGNRLEVEFGGLRLGLNGANLHIYQSTRAGGSTLKGVIHPQQPRLDWVLVRFSDDSPADGRGGPVVHSVELVVDGTPRPDIKPTAILRRDRIDTQLGTISLLTGKFRSIVYDNPTAPDQASLFASHAGPIFYRDRNELPLYADYMYRLDHENGFDVEDITNLKGLLENFEVVSPDETQEVSGDLQLVYLFDLSAAKTVRSVEVEVMVANDYRIDVATLFEPQPDQLRTPVQEYFLPSRETREGECPRPVQFGFGALRSGRADWTVHLQQ